MTQRRKTQKNATMLKRIIRLGTICLLPLIPLTAHADDAVWQRIDKKGIKSGSIEFGLRNLFAITCPASLPSAQPRLLLHAQTLMTDFNEKSRYNLRVVINDYRADFGMKPKDGNLVLDAVDFNQRDIFNGLVQALIEAAKSGVDHGQIAVSSLGWREDLPLASADQVLAGLMDGCGE